MLRRTIVLSLIATLTFGLMPVQPVSAQQGQAAVLRPIAVTIGGVVSGLAGTFEGTATISRFLVRDGQMLAVGTMTGAIRDEAGTIVRSVVTTFEAPVTQAQATCGILHLELGPISLNLLGLAINTNLIVLDISAVPSPGNLLGNLLCAVANLLNGGGGLDGTAGLLRAVSNLLNQILVGL